jgi:chemotaxis protein CheD
VLDRFDASGLFAPDPNLLEVGVGELAVAEHPKRLLTPALGSCVGISIWDPQAHRGGMAHVMLPTPTGGSSRAEFGRFAQTAVPQLIAMLVAQGSAPRRLVAKIAGGAAMFRGEVNIAHIGERNIAEVRHQLSLMSIPLVAEDTGEGHARTIELRLDTGVLVVRSYKYGVREI